MISFKNLGSMGRLGNQLFQMSATIALALRNNDKYVFPPWPEENNFNLYDCFSSDIQNTKEYRETSFSYSPIEYKPNLDLVGFFQSEKYFEDYKDIIIRNLTPRVGFGMFRNTTSIHVRRGDYLKFSESHTHLEMQYYLEAMQTIKSEKYLVFSDDIAWCKNNFTGDNITFIEGNSPAVDLSLMLGSEHNIIANSSFSWWGAYLNKNPSKIVVAPKNWFGPKLLHDTKDLLPKEWIKI